MAKSISKNKTKLSLLDRIIIKGLVSAKESDFASLIVVKDLIAKIEITQDEIKKFEIKQVGEGQNASIVWNAKGSNAVFEYDFTELERMEIKLALQKISDEKKLNLSLLPLYEKFIH